MEELAVAGRHRYQQNLQGARPHSVVNRLTRESSGEGASSSDDELAGETHFEARVGILCRKKSSKVQFEQDPTERVLQLQGDQVKLKKKDKLKEKIFVYYVWVRRNISDYVPRESHRLKDENLAILAGWYKDLMIITFATNGEKESFLIQFQQIHQETIYSLYGEYDPSEHCLVHIGACISSSEKDTPQAFTVKSYETANDVVRKCKGTFKLDQSLRAQLWLDGTSSYCMVGCESIFSAILYEIHERHKSSSRRRGSVLSEASSNSPNESNSMELDESIGKEPKVQLMLHAQDTCSAASCATRKKKSHQHHQQLRRTSEVPGKIRSWIASNRKSQLVRQGSVETLAASNGTGVSGEPSPIIGRPLNELYPSGTVSRPVTCLLAQIYNRCFQARGIFRQPGSVSEKNQVLQLLSRYDLTTRDNMKQLNDFGEHCIADALKHYLRNLPGCLLQTSLSSHWISIVRDLAGDTPKAVATIRSVIRKMNPQNAHLLHMLMATLRRVADNQALNQMTPANIGTSVSFSVLELSPQGGTLEAMEQEAQWVNKLLELMIANYGQIWPDEAENERVRADFVRHMHQHEELSSMESLTTDAPRHTDHSIEPLSMSTLSKDSGLQLSDQQLDDNRRGGGGAPIATVPERLQPPPYEIVMRRQGRSQRSRESQKQQPQPQPEPAAPVTPRRERPPVPARLHKRPASLGPSGRMPLPSAAQLALMSGNGNAAGTAVSGSNNNLQSSALTDSRTRHPLSATGDGRQLAAAPQTPPQRPSTPPQAFSRPVRGVASVTPATAAAAAMAAAQQPPPPKQPPLQPRFRKRSSSETRLDLIGLGPAPLPTPAGQQQQVSQSPFHRFLQPHQHQHHHQSQHQHQLPEPQQPHDSAARQRRQDFERLVRLHNRDSYDFTAPAAPSAPAAGVLVRSPFSSRHAPIRGSAANHESATTTSPRQPRPRTRLPEALQQKLADQPESLV